jgi:DNA polymerase-3 subunit alpha
LEGLVKAGAFDNLNINRQSLYNSIPNLILKTKNIFDNKIANQIDLFENDEGENANDDNLLAKIKDWDFEERLSKEFEAIGFFISDHPINQYKDIFNDYKIINYNSFKSDDLNKQCNIAATLLKIQEKKTAKGNSYAVLKLTDLSSVFELFIFSDVLELNRNILSEGNSLLITLNKNLSNDENRFRRINVSKISLIKELFNKPISELKLSFNDLNKISNLKLPEVDGKTNVILKYQDDHKSYVFKLKKNRKIDRNLLNLIKKDGIFTEIN